MDQCDDRQLLLTLLLALLGGFLGFLKPSIENLNRQFEELNKGITDLSARVIRLETNQEWIMRGADAINENFPLKSPQPDQTVASGMNNGGLAVVVSPSRPGTSSYVQVHNSDSRPRTLRAQVKILALDTQGNKTDIYVTETLNPSPFVEDTSRSFTIDPNTARRYFLRLDLLDLPPDQDCVLEYSAFPQNKPIMGKSPPFPCKGMY